MYNDLKTSEGMLHTKTLVKLVIDLIVRVISEWGSAFPTIPYFATRWQHWACIIHPSSVTLETFVRAFGDLVACIGCENKVKMY